MRNIVKSIALTAIFATAATVAQPSDTQAGVINVVPKETISQPSSIEQVHYRRHHHHWRHHHWRHHHWRHHHWRHAHYRHHWRHRYYRYGYYPRYYYPGYYPWYNPAGALAGAAVGLATAPFWALTGPGWWW